MHKAPIWVAIDTVDIDRACAVAQGCAPYVAGIKLGLEFFLAHGQSGVLQVIKACALPLFLDLKLHDIPNTVGKAMQGLLGLPIYMMTIHASGGAAMIERAVNASHALAPHNGGARPMVIAVSVLTSLGAEDMPAIGVMDSPEIQAVRLAKLARDAGADGVVCSPHEITAIRAACGNEFQLIVPGIRPYGAPTDDQKRAMTPKEALALGATYLVIGRPITGADDVGKAAREISDSLVHDSHISTS